MPIPFKGPNAFHCFNTDTNEWRFAFVTGGNLFVFTRASYDRFNKITSAPQPKEYNRDVVKTSQGNRAVWEQVAKDDLGNYTLFNVSNGTRDMDTEKALAIGPAQTGNIPAMPSSGADIPPLASSAMEVTLTKAGVFELNVVDNVLCATKIGEAPGTDPLAYAAAAFPAYWRELPANWKAIDTYRIDALFPLNDTRLTHARKKLLVCGTRTGGKSVRKDVAEAYATLKQWLEDNPED